jgi:hypothetical protein
MSRCVWFGGQDWVGPHRWVGRLVLGHTEPKSGGWESTGHYEDSTETVRQPDIGSGSHPDLCDVLEVFERLSCDVAFQTAHDLSGVLPFVTTTSDIRSGSFIT